MVRYLVLYNDKRGILGGEIEEKVMRREWKGEKES
jgi:hypothetical protein